MLFPSPQEVIRSRLRKLAATASFGPKDSRLARLYKAQKITDFFTPDVVMSVDVRGYEPGTLSGRDDLQRAALALASSQFGELKIEFLDVNVTLSPDKQTAVANLTGKATVEGQHDFSVQEFNFKLRKVDGKWLIYRVETVRTLS